MGFEGEEVGGASLISSSPLLSDLTHCCVQHTHRQRHKSSKKVSYSVTLLGPKHINAPMNAISLNDSSSLS